MKEKLEYLLKSKSLTATSLARMLEIQPSGISHIISGRNKPSFDLVVKLLTLFPDINPDWLLLDSSEIYRSGAAPVVSLSSQSPTFDGELDGAMFGDEKNIASTETSSELKNGVNDIFAAVENGAKRVERVIVLYTDHSFDSYSPR